MVTAPAFGAVATPERRFAWAASGTCKTEDGAPLSIREKPSMYIGLGTVVLIVIIVLVVMALRRG